MTSLISLAVLGDGAMARTLRDHGAPFGRIRLVGPSDPASAVLIDLPPAAPPDTVVAALRAGAVVLCPPPVAQTAAALEAMVAAARAGGGRLLPAGEIAHSAAGRRGFSAIASSDFGALRSFYLAIRQARGTGGDVLDALLPEALDAVLSAVPGPFVSVRVNAGALFGPERDSAVILLRSEAGVVVTLELSRCLPPTLPSPGLGEVEIDAVGAHQAVRIVPQAGAVRIHRDDATALVPWLDAPVLAMLATLEAAVDAPDAAPDGLARAEAALALASRIRDAADQTFVTS